MIKLLLSFMLVCMLCSLDVMAQQDPLYGLYLNNPVTINPAYTGMNNNLNITAGFRKQWAGFDGSPSTLSLTAHSSIAQNRMGVGLIVVKDTYGDINQTQVTGTFAYKLKLDNERTLSFGMQGGILNFKSNDQDLLLQNPDDNAFTPNSQIKPTIGAGVILKSENYMFGLSVPRLLNSSFNLQGQTFSVYQQHYYAFGAYIIPLSERVLLKPSVLVKYTSGSPVSADVNFSINFDRNYTVGVFTRNLNTYGLLAQLNFLDYYRLSYALEIPTNKSVGARYATNEINLGIKLSAFSFHDTSSITNF